MPRLVFNSSELLDQDPEDFGASFEDTQEGLSRRRQIQATCIEKSAAKFVLGLRDGKV
jgi:hypothetical protein